jgi:PAS domain S-box-containing protein
MLDHSEQFDRRFLQRARKFSGAVGIFLMLIGTSVLIGWSLDIFRLKALYAGISMKANTALCLVLAGLSLFLLNLNDQRKLVRIIAEGAAVFVAVVGFLTLSEHVVGWDLRIDQVIFTEPPGALDTTSPGRMGPPASTCFTLAGIALLLLHQRRAVSIIHLNAIVIGLWALLAIIGYAYDAHAFYNIAEYTGIALPTAVALFALGLGLLAARLDEGLTVVIANNLPSGLIARRLLLMSITVPFLLGWIIVLGEWRGHYDPGFGIAILVLSIIVIFTIVTWWNASVLSNAEQQRLRAESTILEKEAGLKRQLSFDEAVMANMGEGLYTVDSQGVVTFMNPAAQRLFGWTIDELRGHRMHDMTHYKHRDGAPFPIEECAGFEALHKGATLIDKEDVFIRKDGTFFDVVYSSSPIVENERITGLVVVFRDVTERKRAEEERERLLVLEQSAREQAETANRLKDEFLTTVSHELRTPLSAILGWASMVRSGRLASDETKRALESIERNARVQAQLVEDILDVSRTISGKLRLDIKPVELITVIKAAVDSILPAAEAKNIQIELSFDPAADRIHADAARLQQVVWNLLANAVKFSPNGGRIELKLERVDSRAQITVADNGEGIDPIFLPKVFNRFQQADGSTTRRHGGLGLGLAIARHLVEMHGGTIEASSEGRGRGSRFTIMVPLASSKAISPPANETIQETTAAVYKAVQDLKGIRILAIDDEKDTREMIRAVLESAGANVMTAVSAKEGLETFAGWKPHVLICDIGMPEEDGFSFIRKVRSMTSGDDVSIPAIALTGYVRIEERMQALDAGYQMFVPKPVEANELTSIIANLVHIKSAN